MTWALGLCLCARGADSVQFTETFISGFTNTEIDVNLEAWVPDNWERLRGVVIGFPGTGDDHRYLARDSTWQAQMAGLGFAFVGAEYTDDNGVYSYIGESHISGQVAGNMQTLLDRMADELGHPELTNAPIFPFGFSHGASLTNAVSIRFGERTLGFVADKLWDFPDPSAPDFAEVPGMFMLGSADGIVLPNYAAENYDEWRSSNAKVAQGVDWGGHSETDQDFIFAYLNEVTKQRYPENQLLSLTPGNPLDPVDIPTSAGWLGETNPVSAVGSVTPIEWPEIEPASQFTGDPLTRSWLPNETMAMVHRAHNSQPIGFETYQLSLEVEPAPGGGAQLQVTAGTTTGSYDGIDLYDENGLFAQLGPGSGTQEVPYMPSEEGNHTLIAVIQYTYEAETHYASMYTTYAAPLAPLGLTGDYNGNGIIDAADYSVWRDALTASATSLLNDPTPGVVDESDFVYWRDHFGDVFGGGYGAASGAAAVPEPASLQLLLIAIVLSAIARRETEAS
jgi:predicted esterase